MNVSKNRLDFFLSIHLFLFLHVFPPSLAPQEYKLLKNAKIYMLGEKDILEQGMILVKGTKIENIGPNLDFPSGARIIDLAGKTMVPGLICPLSSLYLHGRDLTFQGQETPDTDVLEGLNPYDEFVPEVLRHGVTAAYVAPASFQSVGGLGAVVKLNAKEGGIIEILNGAAGLQIRMEKMENRKTSNLLRLSQYHRIRDLFIEAREYRKEWENYRKKLKEYGEAKQDEAKKKLEEPQKPQRDEGKEILVQAMDKKIPVHIETHRAEAILQALALKKEFGLAVMLEKCEEWPEVFPLLDDASVSILSHPLLNHKKFLLPGGAKGVAASLLGVRSESFFYTEEEKIHERDVDDSAWTRLASSKAAFALIPPDSLPLSAKNMRLYASLLVAQGLSISEALKTITSTPARILGVFGRIGSLEKGKDADLVVLDGEPLSSLSQVDMVMVNGAIVLRRDR